MFNYTWRRALTKRNILPQTINLTAQLKMVGKKNKTLPNQSTHPWILLGRNKNSFFELEVLGSKEVQICFFLWLFLRFTFLDPFNLCKILKHFKYACLQTFEDQLVSLPLMHFLWAKNRHHAAAIQSLLHLESILRPDYWPPLWLFTTLKHLPLQSERLSSASVLVFKINIHSKELQRG